MLGKNKQSFSLLFFSFLHVSVPRNYIQKLCKKWMGRTIRMHTPLRTRSARRIFVEYAFRVAILSTRPQTLLFTSV